MTACYPWYRYALQKTTSAVRTLVHGDDPLRVRLENAYTYSLGCIEPDSFPPELQGQFTAIRTALTWSSCPARGSIAATVAAISDDECWRIAGLILDLHNALSEVEGGHTERTHPSAPLAAPTELELTAEREHQARLLERVRELEQRTTEGETKA